MNKTKSSKKIARPRCDQLIQQNVDQIKRRMAQIDVEGAARASKLTQRDPRKAQARDYLLALVSLATGSSPSLERIATVLGLLIGATYAKQAVQKRIDGCIEGFLFRIIPQLLQSLCRPIHAKGVFKAFGRVWLQDSSTIALPDRFASSFPGCANQSSRRLSQLKFQLVCDLFQGTIAHLSISGFTRNDQAAAPDILAVARRGDLVLRDLGCFVIDCFRQMTHAGIFFLSRYRHRVCLYDPQGKPIRLGKLLARQGSLDMNVCLGEKERLPVRLVALPVPDAVANQHRRQARAKPAHDCHPNKECFFLLGWNIFITNVGPAVWSAPKLLDVYRLRWRIELIFKAWKSHLKFEELNVRSQSMLRLSFALKLIYAAFLHETSSLLLALDTEKLHPSLMRLARIFNDCSCLWTAAFLSLSPYQWFARLIGSHAFHETRRDRFNFFESLAKLGVRLG